eukprot:m.863264 g.863264  ORF g.863264 m.863264 type:complete len:84 (+) comp23541_c0_seq7:44-295(+)
MMYYQFVKCNGSLVPICQLAITDSRNCNDTGLSRQVQDASVLSPHRSSPILICSARSHFYHKLPYLRSFVPNPASATNELRSS